MFFRMIRGAFARQKKKMFMIALTIALGASLATAMLNVMMDVGDKVAQELKTYGANIMVVPKSSQALDDLYEFEGDPVDRGAYLREEELGKIKTIFWAFNIVDYAPFINTAVLLPDGTEATLVGTWFNHHMDLPTGESLDTGIRSLRTWWDVTEGGWLDEQQSGEEVCMAGALIAERLGLHAGDMLSLRGEDGSSELTVVGIFESGDDADEQIFAPLQTAQALGGTQGRVSSIEVSALTTPDNELAEKAATQGPESLSISQYETWYCTAYVSSICYQIQEVISDSVAAPVRQIADSEGAIMEKTQLLMILITLLALVGSALGITNLVTASVMERSNEIGLLKAIGATDSRISALILAEIILTGVIGGIIGYAAGFGFAQIIGQTVFGSAVEMKPMVIPLVAVLVLAVVVLGSLPAIRTLLRLKPTEVLHGR